MKFSTCSFFLATLVLIYSGSLFYPRWQNSGTEAQLSWDAGGYYWYLPSAFIYKDVKKQAFKDSIMHKYAPSPPDEFRYAFKNGASGNYVIRYTMGTAILEAPWFFIAHVIAEPLGYPADGFSLPYQLMIYIGGILFAMLGLWYLRKLLLFHYSDKVVGIVLFLLVFGTNYLNYAGIDVGMTHTWLFTLYVFILLNTHYYYQAFQRKYILRVGALIGLVALVRPPEIIAVIIPALWGLNSIAPKKLAERLRLFIVHWKPVTVAAITSGLILSLQFMYWKYASGTWFVYTYGDQGFSWLSPRFRQYALNFQCGWLLFTPIMFLVIPGIILFAKRGSNRACILLLIAVNFYIVAAWDAWDYGGRAMIQNYPVLLFPLATLTDGILRRKWLVLITVPFILLCVYFNIWWTYQAHAGTLIGGTPGTSAYYRATIFRSNASPETQFLRDNEDLYQQPVKNPQAIYQNNLDTFPGGHITIVADKAQSFIFAAPAQKRKWLRATADFYTANKEWNVWFMTQFIIRLRKGEQVIRENRIRVQRLLDNGRTNTINIDCHLPDDDYDVIELLFMNENKGHSACDIDNIRVITFDE